uniref:Uncharacterized protein n=1 Tax=Melopsittacus undulatus TaxID=13146 RepID=A0A8V5G4M2_MELUD
MTFFFCDSWYRPITMSPIALYTIALYRSMAYSMATCSQVCCYLTCIVILSSLFLLLAFVVSSPIIVVSCISLSFFKMANCFFSFSPVSFFRANTLFNIWIKYKTRLPEWYYNEKLLKVGDSLAQIKEYKLALLQCYGRYLQQFISVNLDDITDDVHQFKSTFFPHGFRDRKAALTFHALQERNVCIYQMVCSSDRNLQNQESLKTCFNVLSSIRLVMQVALPQENLCWLIYNGTTSEICLFLSFGNRKCVLEYLVWASVCMESSIPLLSVHYLTWRTTLYTAVSQCYFDCQDGINGEIFARRGLIKIDELKKLEVTSSSLANSETSKIFREATVKMSVMIFKRAVYEPRRKQKTDFRPNLTLPFLTYSRGVCHPVPPLPDETEIHEVITELFFAGLEILSGNGIRKLKGCKVFW